ncbi:MAG: hypothetical protein IT458_20140 [Planctomycetes bacterium]|nr:hypothetical protein [Planctomycetota bacterium]
MLRALPYLVVLVPALLPAQSLVAPSGAAAEQAGHTWFPGFGTPMRDAYLLDAAHLPGLSGRNLVGLDLRRDLGRAVALAGGAAQLEIHVSHAAASADAPEPAFDANHGADRTLVFRGTVQVPNSPVPGPAPDPWGSGNAVSVDFTTPFAYRGGTLCVEVVGRTVAGQVAADWPVDAAVRVAPGTTTEVGTGCGALGLVGPSAVVGESRLQPGSTALLEASGKANTPGLLFVGVQEIPGGADLSGLGMTGCRLHVAPAVTLPALYQPSVSTRMPGLATASLRLPRDPALAGASLWFQWLDLETSLPPSQWSNALGVSLTNAVRATIAAVPAAGFATVSADLGPTGLPAEGQVSSGRIPVLRLRTN